MPEPLPVPVGVRFTRLLVLAEPYTIDGDSHRVVDVLCDCGKRLTVPAYRVVSGRVKSCGCLRNEMSRARMLRPENPLRRRGKDSVRYKPGGRADKDEWLRREKSHPCVDCTHAYHYSVMQFDHVPDRGEKSFEINSRAIYSGSVSLNDMLAERAKCDLVCANCHAWRTWLRKTNQTVRPWSEVLHG